MYKFFADRLHVPHQHLMESIQHYRNPANAENAMDEMSLFFLMDDMGRRAGEIGLELTERKCAENKAYFDLMKRMGDRPKPHAICTPLEQLMDIMRLEMTGIKVLAFEGDEKKIFESAAPFGPEVARKFDREHPDIIEAANCLAVERDTATVFHLTRALEGLVRRFGAKFRLKIKDRKGRSIAIKNAMWNDILISAESKIKTERAGRLRPERKKQLDKYEGLIHQLDHIRNAWRNPVSHGEFFEHFEAQNLYQLTRIFAQGLVKIL